MIDDAPLIVTARLVDEVTETVEIPSPVVDHSGAFRDDVIRTFEPVEVIKGELVTAGETFQVWYSVGTSLPASGRIPARVEVRELERVENGRTYLLFLEPIPRDGVAMWGQIGAPGIAEVTGETLSFIAPVRYLEALADRGLSPSRSDSAAPFDVSLTEFRDIASDRVGVQSR